MPVEGVVHAKKKRGRHLWDGVGVVAVQAKECSPLPALTTQHIGNVTVCTAILTLLFFHVGPHRQTEGDAQEQARHTQHTAHGRKAGNKRKEGSKSVHRKESQGIRR